MREFVVKDRAEATAAWMAGDDAAMAAAESKAAKLVGSWLGWLAAQSVEALPALRIDVLIKRVGPGAAEVFTLELTELGFSMLGVDTLPPLVFGALLSSCFEDTKPTDAEAHTLARGRKRLEDLSRERAKERASQRAHPRTNEGAHPRANGQAANANGNGNNNGNGSSNSNGNSKGNGNSNGNGNGNNNGNGNGNGNGSNSGARKRKHTTPPNSSTGAAVKGGGAQGDE